VRVCFLTCALPAAEPVAGYADRLGAVVATSAPEGEFDVAVATDWTSTAHVFEVRARRFAFWVDHFAHRRMGTWQAERFAAQLAYDLPVDFIAAAPWVRDTLADLRPDARCLLVTSGAPEVAGAGAAAPAGGPLRVHLAGDGDERAAFAAMEEQAVEVPLAAGPDVVVMLSTVDGVLGAPLAGFRAGATAVVGPAHDAQDLVRHGENGLIADADDVRGAARWLDHLARDRELLGRLRSAARATGEAWPSREQAAEELRAALERIVAEEPPAQASWPVRLMGDAIGGAAVFRQELATLTAEVHRLRAAPPSPARRALGALKRRAKSRLAG
jgi:glycosyltransferase involved in cell wall biosynthesis